MDIKAARNAKVDSETGLITFEDADGTAYTITEAAAEAIHMAAERRYLEDDVRDALEERGIELSGEEFDELVDDYESARSEHGSGSGEDCMPWYDILDDVFREAGY